MGKSRLAPLNEKSLTIPKLELQAAVIASRLKVKILEEIDLNIHRIYFWTDSKTVLKYIRNENKRFPVYIMLRVSEIRYNSDINNWHFISGSINVSDHCTRPLSFEDLVKQNDYLYGPKILFQPLENVLSTDDKHIILEHQVEQNSIDISNKHTTMNNPVLPYQHYSSWQKLVRHIAYIKLLTRNWKNKKDNCESIPLVLTREILDEARETILIVVQKETFTSEYQCLKSNSPLKIRSKLLQLSPILVNNLIKVGGRLRHSNLPQYHKHQTILPANHHVTTLIINHFHENYHHCGRDQTLAIIREQFWITNGKSIVKKSLNKCIPCRKQKITPQPQFMSDLPAERLAYNEPAFSFTGTDYFGPLIVKQSKKTRQNLGQCKRYGVVFTCLTTRALHLELAGDLSTDSFILALRRFIARRGQPNTIWSDNGTNYVDAERELRTLLAKLNQNKISSTLINKNIIWKFNHPSSPWMGGSWESIVKITKKCLKFVTKERPVYEDSLVTFLAEVENTLNSRPLTSLSDDSNDLSVLTPNHFLLGRQPLYFSPATINDEHVNSRTRWKALQALSKMFWSRFVKEYLPALQIRKKWNKPQRNMQENDIVIVMEDNIHRSHWPLARVIETYPGRDGIVRSVRLKLPNTELMRPCNKLCLLEESS